MRHPPGQLGLESASEIGSHVEKPTPRSTTEPLENASHRKIHFQSFDVEGNDPRRLKDIQHNQSTHTVSVLDDRVRGIQARLAVRAWDYRQRNLSKGVWRSK